jgi:hypothetical protein
MRWTQWQRGFVLSIITGVGLLNPISAVQSLPPPDDPPEEILRTEIITEARSPIDGRPLTPAEYAELQAALEAGPEQFSRVDPKLQEIIVLLRLRRTIRTFFPFLLR